ncbi:uncharacterized protein LOC118748765 [Rhagoletis pomonella]|uniref:uncharacterized protein LOC118748765 n=1 Tax=Rhagoletis pomonella TaxID=28610 RepID=UPI0017803C62|nr:uncharacterized protein LOC118748765 [Rhagoletis pomonella]
MSRAQNREKKLAVLEVVKKKKNILFGTFQNKIANKIEKEAAWKEVLEKAQSLGLAAPNRDWTYARDHIFGLWKSRALAKRDVARKAGVISISKSLVCDAVDACILDILENESTVKNDLSLLEGDGTETNIESQISNINESQLSSHRTATTKQSTKRKRDSCIDMGRLKAAVLESELYKNKLKIMALERDLGLKASKFTKKLAKLRVRK